MNNPSVPPLNLSSHPVRVITVTLLVGLALTAPLGAQAGASLSELRAAQGTVDSLLPSRNHAALGVAYRVLGALRDDAGDATAAIAEYRQAILHAGLAADSVTLGAVRNNIGLLHWTANRYDSALTNLSTSRDIRLALGDTVGLSRVLNSLGASYYQLGTYEPALDAFMQALEIRRSDKKRAGVAVVLTNIGKTYHDWRQYERAQPTMEQAVATALAEGEPVAAGYALNALAMLQIDRRDYQRAQRFLEQSIATYRSADSLMSRADSASAWSLNSVSQGLLLVRRGRAVDAIPLLESVLAAGERRGSIRGQARSLLYLGGAYSATGQSARAISALTRSLELSRSVAQRVITIDALALLADLEEKAGRTDLALLHLRAHQALRDTIFDQSTAQRIAAMEARAETERQQQENARLRADKAVQSVVIARGRLVVALGAVILLSAAVVLGMLAHFNRKGRARELLLASTNADLELANSELRSALSEVRTLTGLIPICSHCKKVRDDDGYWEAVETYVSSRSEASFSHSICSSCGPEHYGDLWPSEPPLTATQ